MEKLEGDRLLHEPTMNLGESFPLEKRDELKIRGLVPTHYLTPELQEKRILAEFDAETDPLKKFLLLSDLYDRNIHLYFYIVTRHFSKLAPFVYTPHVGTYCLKYHEIYRPKRCLYYSLDDEDHIDDITAAWPLPKVEVVVVTDGGRILGLGDLGANGIGIPIGKLALYCAAAGSDPRCTLPVQIDAGTNNVSLRENPLYMGLHKERIHGERYFSFVEKVILSLHKRFPEALIQFEDFGIENAFVLLQKWRDRILSFNDDIQGTGAVVLSVILNALRLKGENSLKALLKERIVIAGAGSACIGICNAIVNGMKEEGIKKEEAVKIFYICNSKGLLGRNALNLSPQQLDYQRDDMDVMSLLDVVKQVKPTFLLGVSGKGGIFTEEIIKIVSESCERPFILPMSNPTSKSECKLEDVAKWTDGRAIFASGSPFNDIKYKNKEGKEIIIKGNQCNNMYIFPALGLGCSKSHAKRVSDKMLYTASLSLANEVKEEEIKKGILLPSLDDAWIYGEKIAADVIIEGIKEDNVDVNELLLLGCKSKEREDILEWLRNIMYKPEKYI